MMNFKILFFYLIIIILIVSCTKPVDMDDGLKIENITSSQLSDGCGERYAIQFSDKLNDNATSYYWCGLRKKQNETDDDYDGYDYGPNIVDSSDTNWAWTGDVSNGVVYLDITSKVYLSELEQYKIFMYKSPDFNNINNNMINVANDNYLVIPEFPLSCDSFTLGFYSGVNTILQDDECIYIDNILTMPEMPEIRPFIQSSNVTGNIRWDLTIEYNRSGRNDRLFRTSGLIDVNQSWTPYFGFDFQGGQAELACYSEDLDASAVIKFGIRAYNPGVSEAENFIDAVASAVENSSTDYMNGSRWFYKYVAKHEADEPTQGRFYAQFNEVPTFPPDCSDPNDVRYTPNASNNSDGGFGLYQLTNYYSVDESKTMRPSSQALWDWQENVDEGTDYLEYHYSGRYNNALDYMAGERLKAVNWNILFLYVDEETLGQVTFKDQTAKSIEGAVAMKRYNGLGGTGNGEYCQWDNVEHEWQMNRLNSYSGDGGPFNYVLRVCQTYP